MLCSLSLTFACEKRDHNAFALYKLVLETYSFFFKVTFLTCALKIYESVQRSVLYVPRLVC